MGVPEAEAVMVEAACPADPIRGRPGGGRVEQAGGRSNPGGGLTGETVSVVVKPGAHEVESSWSS